MELHLLVNQEDLLYLLKVHSLIWVRVKKWVVLLIKSSQTSKKRLPTKNKISKIKLKVELK